MSNSKSLGDGKDRKGSRDTKNSHRLLLAQESVDDECEIDLMDEDEHKTPLIKDTPNGTLTSADNKGSKFKKSKLTLNLNGNNMNNGKNSGSQNRKSKMEEEDDEEDEEADDEDEEP